TKEQMHLESLVRQLKVGDPVLFPDGELVSVTGYQETIWYANAASATPQTAPSAPAVPVPIPHSQIDFTVPSGTPDRSGLNGADKRKTVTLRYAWQPAGELIPTPATQFDDKSPDPSLGATALKVDQAVLVEDANGHGARAKITDTGLHLSAPFDKLMAPLRALPNLLPVTRGQTVEREILGSGDARLPGQEFVLQKSPLTYLPSDDSKLGTGYKSTLRVWVDEIEWHEVSSFYGQPRDAKVFVTREDEDNKTHVLTGDGGFGARLSTGVNNVVASYRYGSGVAVPGADALTVVVRPLPRLTAIRNPVPPGGGADPEPADRIRRLAPRSVLTFGRAVSADDYEVIAAAAPGVTRAQAAWVWDAVRQRTLVKVFVGDDAGAVDSARLALAGAGDPNRPVRVEAATPVDMALELTLVFDPDRTPDPVVKAVASALLAPDTGLFSAGKVRVGQSLFASAIHAACLKVPGVLAVHALKFATQQGATKTAPTGFRFDPGEGKFFRLTAERLEVHHVP
ncbi:MAG TPA: baseplate J/gp47 family protein, partial [Gemmataceae bacterium]|nr:baseplate J/gp47 family protein [Gemmataceae bacterium]